MRILQFPQGSINEFLNASKLNCSSACSSSEMAVVVCTAKPAAAVQFTWDFIELRNKKGNVSAQWPNFCPRDPRGCCTLLLWTSSCLIMPTLTSICALLTRAGSFILCGSSSRVAPMTIRPVLAPDTVCVKNDSCTICGSFVTSSINRRQKKWNRDPQVGNSSFPL